jgi:RNase P subunit RPR2
LLHVLRRLWSKPSGNTDHDSNVIPIMTCDRCNTVLREHDLGVSLSGPNYTIVICEKCLLSEDYTDVNLVKDEDESV